MTRISFLFELNGTVQKKLGPNQNVWSQLLQQIWLLAVAARTQRGLVENE